MGGIEGGYGVTGGLSLPQKILSVVMSIVLAFGMCIPSRALGGRAYASDGDLTNAQVSPGVLEDGDDDSPNAQPNGSADDTQQDLIATTMSGIKLKVAKTVAGEFTELESLTADNCTLDTNANVTTSNGTVTVTGAVTYPKDAATTVLQVSSSKSTTLNLADDSTLIISQPIEVAGALTVTGTGSIKSTSGAVFNVNGGGTLKIDGGGRSQLDPTITL